MSEANDPLLYDLAASIDDAIPVSWEEQAAHAPHLRAKLARMRQIERVASAYRSLGGAQPAGAGTATGGQGAGRRQTLFRWGPLEVLEKLGEGSYSEVYRASDPLLGRDVALKLRREGRTPPGEVDLDEARRLAQVRHPNVLVVHGVALHEGRVGTWTDLISGETLEEKLARDGPLGAAEATAIGIDLCRALAAVHTAGLVHGDLKAANVMREMGGRTVLLDFGAAAAIGSPDEAPQAAVTGTPLTLAPELLRGGAPSPATDVYALGALLFRLVTCRYPVPASSFAELSAKHERRERLALADLRPELPVGFLSAVERGLAADPGDRHLSVGAMGRALASLAGTLPSEEHAPAESPRAPGTWSWRWTLLAAATAVALLGIAVVYLRVPAKSPAGAGSVRSLAILPMKTLGGNPGDEYLGLALADALITRLSAEPRLRVRPTTSVLAYSDATADSATTGRHLGVETVLHGNVHRSGERLRVTLQSRRGVALSEVVITGPRR